MYAMLGDIQFDLIPFEGFDQSSSVNYVQCDTVSGKPALQFTGENLDEINIQLKFHADFCTPADEIKKLNSAMKKGQSLPFVFANGEYLGNFVIKSTQKKLELTASDGTIISADFSLSLLEGSLTEKEKEQQQKNATKQAMVNTNSAVVVNTLPERVLSNNATASEIVRMATS